MNRKLEINGKSFWLLAIDSSEDIALPFGRAPFPCMIFATRPTSMETKCSFAKWLIKNDCRFVVCAGVECSMWHDVVDLEYISSDPEYNPPEERFLLTTWHTDQSVDEVIDFFVMNTNFDMHDFTNYMVLIIGQNLEAMLEFEERIKSRLLSEQKVKRPPN